MTANEALAQSPTLHAAADEVIAFAVEQNITDPARLMELMDEAVPRIHAELRVFVDLALSQTDEGRAIRRAIMLDVWTRVRASN